MHLILKIAIGVFFGLSTWNYFKNSNEISMHSMLTGLAWVVIAFSVVAIGVYAKLYGQQIFRYFSSRNTAKQLVDLGYVDPKFYYVVLCSLNDEFSISTKLKVNSILKTIACKKPLDYDIKLDEDELLEIMKEIVKKFKYSVTV